LISTKELYWAAGFIEGEGCFSTYKRRITIDFRIVVSQVEIEPLIHLQNLFGGTIHRIKRKAKGCGYIHTWQLYNAKARGLAMTLFSLMSTKRQNQIRVMLSNPWYPQLRGTNGKFISPRKV
jgi:hypothetical protein